MKKVSILVLVSFIFNCGEAFSAPRNSRVRTSGGRRAFVRSAGNENAGGVAVQAPQIQTPTVETPSVPVVFDADVPVLGEEVNTAEVRAKIANLQQKISEVRSECSGIKKDLDTIFGFTTATTVASGIGTVAAGGALVSGVMKSKKDKIIEEKENELKLLQSRTDNLSDDPEVLKQQIAEIMPSLDEDYARLQKEIEEETKKSKMLGNVRTGLMAGATVTSAVSTGTSIGATVNAEKLAKKMSDCNEAVRQLKLAISVAEAEEVEEEKLAHAREITSACTGFDKDNINTLKTQMTASAIVSGIGTATAGAGTITSAMANSKKVREDDSEKGRKKEKGLNLASNILAGVTMGTSATSTVLSATAISKAKKDSKMAEKCEAVLK